MEPTRPAECLTCHSIVSLAGRAAHLEAVRRAQEETLPLEGIQALIDGADSDPHRFPPTLIYSEGWMLRLVLRWFEAHKAPTHYLGFQTGATWFSEALLPSPFLQRHRGDRRAEAHTHADGIIGHFTIGSVAKADAKLLPDASQFVVTEAKIYSPLSPGTRNAPTYDQAARNVACVAELLSRAHRQPNEMNSLAFFVVAPRRHINEGAIGEKLGKTSIEKAVRSRAQAYSPELDPWVEDWFLPTLQAMTIMPLSWEQLIADIASQDGVAAQALSSFYERCLKYNTVPRNFVPA